MTQSREPLTLAQTLAIGSATGAAGVIFEHPLFSLKTRKQNKESFTLNPLILYRGFWTNAVSMVPITAMQVVLAQLIHKHYFKDSPELSLPQKLGCSFAAGLGSALISCPAELVMNHQGRTGLGFFPTVKSLVKEGGPKILWRGLAATALREGIFTTFFLSGTNLVEEALMRNAVPQLPSSLLAGLSCGGSSALLSQAPDTIKTKQQSAPPKQFLSFRTSAKTIYKQEGVLGFFNGGLPRNGQVMVTLATMATVYKELKNHCETKNSEAKAKSSQGLAKR